MSDTSQKKQSAAGKGSRVKINVGVIIFSLIFLYIIAVIVSYFTKAHFSFSEVARGSIIDSDTFTALILRDEQTISASRSGYINYFVNDSGKTARNGNVCIIDGSRLTPGANNAGKAIEISSSDYADIKELITSYKKDYLDNHYGEVYSLDYQLGNVLNNIISLANISQLSNMATNTNYTIMKAANSGIVSYTVDGLETLTMDDIDHDVLNKKDYHKQQVSAGSFIESGSPAFKIIKDSTWKLVIAPGRAQIDKLKAIPSVADDGQIDIHFLKDDITTTASVDFYDHEGNHLVIFTLDSYMSRYCNDRYEDIEIVWNSQKGLKIPKSSIVSKTFYRVPESYLITEKGTTEFGIQLSTPEGPVLEQPTIYRNRDEKVIYVAASDIDEGSTLIEPKTGNKYTVDLTQSSVELPGVYNINKGYAYFRMINVLYEYGDYCIVKEGLTGGISLYDHILLNGSSAYENQVIF